MTFDNVRQRMLLANCGQTLCNIAFFTMYGNSLDVPKPIREKLNVGVSKLNQLMTPYQSIFRGVKEYVEKS